SSLAWGLVNSVIQHEVSTSETVEHANKKVKVNNRCEKPELIVSDSGSHDSDKDCEDSSDTVHTYEIQNKGKTPTNAHVDGTLKCQFCRYKAKTKVALARHVKRTHTGDGKSVIWKFICDVCEYKCTQTNVFVEHTRIHTGEKPFSCDKCEHKFARKSDYMRHLKLHIGEKPYSCEFCAHKFSRNSDLVRHMRTHTGEKPYRCEYCDFRFSRNSDLVNHKRTHTGEKPYACNLCDYRCTRNSNLFRHNLKNHTRDSPNS
ncbi:jg22383, partial [Pararge aegeria aegeria]